LYVALALAADRRYAGIAIVVLLPDGGERYLSSALFSPDR
jgi:cysteine synthase